MKTSFRIASVLTLLGLLGAAGGASAQYAPYAPYTQRPQVSPYLNLLRGGATPGQNYYSLVRPQLNFQAGLAGAQQQGQLNQALITGLAATATGPVTTGQPFGFQTQQSYFQNQFSGGGGGAGQIGFGLGTGGRNQPGGSAGGATGGSPAGAGGGRRGR